MVSSLIGAETACTVCTSDCTKEDAPHHCCAARGEVEEKEKEDGWGQVAGDGSGSAEGEGWWWMVGGRGG